MWFKGSKSRIVLYSAHFCLLSSYALQHSAFFVLLYHENMLFTMELQSQSSPPMCSSYVIRVIGVLLILIRLVHGKTIDVPNVVMQTIVI